MKEIINVISLILFINTIMGAIFCHVIIINVFIHDKPSMISGNQKCKGAAPIFISREEFIIIDIVGLKLFIMMDSKEFNMIIENSKVDEATTWVMKYFRDDSEDRTFSLLFIRGIIDNRLISKPIHIPIQEYDEMVIMVPIIVVDINSNLYKLGNKKKRIIAFINEV